MKYLRDLLRISVFVLVMYLPLSWISVQKSLESIHQMREQKQVDNLIRVQNATQELLSEGRLLEACQRLKAEAEAHNITTYTLNSADGNCHELLTTLPPVRVLGAVETFNIKGSELNFIRQKTGQIEWAISVPTPQKISFIHEMKTNPAMREAVLLDLAIVIYIILAFIFLGVLILTKSIQNKYRKIGKDPVWLKFINTTFGFLQLHDLKILKFATEATLKKNEDLLKDQDLLETSLEYSILNEIREHQKKIPYTFLGAVCKVDINGFSKMIGKANANETQNLTRALEDFGCELLQRYQGLFEKTVGDEIVVVFKTHDCAKLSTAFARDLMKEFSLLEFAFGSEKRKFTLKSSISSSEVTFSKRAPGYGFFGDALTYTTRLLEVVNIKDSNILSCLEKQIDQIKELVVIPSEVRRFEFKNMSSDKGYLIDQFISVEDVYQQNQDQILKYFRSDSALIYLLNQTCIETKIEKLDLIFDCFALTRVRVCSAALIQAWINAIQKFERRLKADPTLTLPFTRLLIEGVKLIPKHQWNQLCTDTLLGISRDIESRVNASVVDILIDKDLNHVALEYEQSFLIEGDTSYRTEGNLLVSQALHQLSNSVFNRILRMLNSNNKAEVSTGLYCAARIILQYQKQNPAELETFTSYRKLIKHLRSLAKDNYPNTSDRLVALLKEVHHNSSHSHPDA